MCNKRYTHERILITDHPSLVVSAQLRPDVLTAVLGTFTINPNLAALDEQTITDRIITDMRPFLTLQISELINNRLESKRQREDYHETEDQRLTNAADNNIASSDDIHIDTDNDNSENWPASDISSSSEIGISDNNLKTVQGEDDMSHQAFANSDLYQVNELVTDHDMTNREGEDISEGKGQRHTNAEEKDYTSSKSTQHNNNDIVEDLPARDISTQDIGSSENHSDILPGELNLSHRDFANSDLGTSAKVVPVQFPSPQTVINVNLAHYGKLLRDLQRVENDVVSLNNQGARNIAKEQNLSTNAEQSAIALRDLLGNLKDTLEDFDHLKERLPNVTVTSEINTTTRRPSVRPRYDQQ